MKKKIIMGVAYLAPDEMTLMSTRMLKNMEKDAMNSVGSVCEINVIS